MQAILILAHTAPEHVIKLSKLLRKSFEIYIHFDKKTKQYYQPHEHNYFYNKNGQPIGKTDGPLPNGYTNMSTR